MLVLDQQLHGYRHGHELLSTSTSLPKSDQTLIDRLSDIAGSLSPGEKFPPYLTFYALPSGSHYVIARTWQDLDAPRAGCVRTRSLLVSMSDWVDVQDIEMLVEAATTAGPIAPAESLVLDASIAKPLPPVEKSTSMELLEAIFLEDREPIVVFDSEYPELITARLLSAFWPGMRRTFCVSTFARSPRMIQKRSFDLVFAPKDARSRFGDWKGRRIDGRKAGNGRHRWSEAIAQRVFVSPTPSLLLLDALGEMSLDAKGSESALRISLLWEELHSKLATSPNAALGLIDIANTRPTLDIKTVHALELVISDSAQLAAATMPTMEAWRFLAAMTDKLRDLNIAESVVASIRGTAVNLAAAKPTDAIQGLPEILGAGQRAFLLSAVGDGVARVLNPHVSSQLSNLDEQTLLELVLASPLMIENVLTHFPGLFSLLRVAIEGTGEVKRIEAGRRMLEFLVDERHVDLARVVFAGLDGPALVDEVKYLHEVNGLESPGLRELIVTYAGQKKCASLVRSAAAELGEGNEASALVDALVNPNADDLGWLLSAQQLGATRRLAMIASLVHSANRDQLRSMLSDENLLGDTLNLLLGDAPTTYEALFRIVINAHLPPETLVELSVQIIPYLDARISAEVADRALRVLLPRDFGDSILNSLGILLNAAGPQLNVAQAFRMGAQRGVSGTVASRNLVAFNSTHSQLRKRFVDAVHAMAMALVDRSRIDISLQASDAAAQLLWAAYEQNEQENLKASAVLLPALMRATHDQISPLIAAAFPPVYHELRQENVPDFMSFVFIFLDWDKCKSARRTLIDAFMNSDWRAIDIALAAVRTVDGRHILTRLSAQRGGDRAIAAIKRDIQIVPPPWQARIRSALLELRNDAG